MTKSGQWPPEFSLTFLGHDDKSQHCMCFLCGTENVLHDILATMDCHVFKKKKKGTQVQV